MMDDAMRDLYQDMILGHNKNPRNKGKLAAPDRQQEGYNPLCGDQVTVQLKMGDGKITEIAFDGHGCAIHTASASMMTEAVNGKTAEDAQSIAEAFVHMVMRDRSPELDLIGKLQVFAGVGEFPARVKCATLPWRTLEAALAGEENPATTE